MEKSINQMVDEIKEVLYFDYSSIVYFFEQTEYLLAFIVKHLRFDSNNKEEFEKNIQLLEFALFSKNPGIIDLFLSNPSLQECIADDLRFDSNNKEEFEKNIQLLEFALFSKNSGIIDLFLLNLSSWKCIFNLDFSNGNNIELLKLVLFSEHLRVICLFMENNSFKTCFKNLDFSCNTKEFENYVKLFKLVLFLKPIGLMDTLLQNVSSQTYISNTLEFPRDKDIFKQLLKCCNYTIYKFLAENKSFVNCVLNLKTKRKNNSLNEEEKEMFDLISKENFVNIHLVKNKTLTEGQKNELKQIFKLTSQEETYKIEMIKGHYYNFNKTISDKEQKEELEIRLGKNNGMIYNSTQQLNQLQGASNGFDSKTTIKSKNSFN